MKSSSPSCRATEARGIGNTTSGSEQKFLIARGLARRTKLQESRCTWMVIGRSNCSALITDKVGKLILYAIGCGGKGSVPPSREFLSVLTNGTGTSEERIARVVPFFFPQEWRNENPNYLESIPKTSETVLNQTLSRQLEAAANAPGTCDRLKNITQPTLS